MDDDVWAWWSQRLYDEGYLDGDLILEELFVHVDTEGHPCRCGCHPSLGSSSHGGDPCPCTRTREERAASWRAWLDEADAERSAWERSAEGRAELARVAHERDELDAWIASDDGVRVDRWGGCFPEQWWGSVDGHTYYFRSKRGVWSIEIDLQPTGDSYRRVVADDAAVDALAEDPAMLLVDGEVEVDEDGLRTVRVAVQQGAVIAHGFEADVDVTPLDRARFIVDTIRAHLRQLSCAHPSARRFCPECGASMA